MNMYICLFTYSIAYSCGRPGWYQGRWIIECVLQSFIVCSYDVKRLNGQYVISVVSKQYILNGITDLFYLKHVYYTTRQYPFQHVIMYKTPWPNMLPLWRYFMLLYRWKTRCSMFTTVFWLADVKNNFTLLKTEKKLTQYHMSRNHYICYTHCFNFPEHRCVDPNRGKSVRNAIRITDNYVS